MPVSIFRSVDLPLPDFPTIAICSPCLISRLIFLIASNLPALYQFAIQIVIC